jgi:hypothetical protein
MEKLFFVFTIIGLVSFGCTKIDNDTPSVKKVGVIDGSFEAQLQQGLGHILTSCPVIVPTDL